MASHERGNLNLEKKKIVENAEEFVNLFQFNRHFSRKYPIQLTISDKKTDKKSPGYDQMVEMNWFDFEEMKDVSATFLEKERQYEVEKGEVKIDFQLFTYFQSNNTRVFQIFQ